MPVLNASLRFMRDYDHYEEMIRALTALCGCYLRQGDLAQARVCLEEAYELSLSQHFPWQRSEICYRLGAVALEVERCEEAEHWAQRAQASINEGSSSDWLGPVYVLLARILQRRSVSTEQVGSLYQQAISLAEARCRGVERAWALAEASNYLAAKADGDARAQARAVARRAEEWLGARGIPVSKRTLISDDEN